VPSGPFYNFDQPGVEPSEAVIANWWRQGMMGAAKGQYECVSEFIGQEYTADLKKISVPVLAMHGDADQIVPYATSAPRAVDLLQNGTLKTYKGFPTACRPPTPRRSTRTCWHSSSPDQSGG
jgi:non-heme chloroperoxidase